MKKCGRRHCQICPRMVLASSIYSRGLHYNIRLPQHYPKLTCTTKRVVYAIKCKVHHKIYVGQTIRMLRERISEHIAVTKKFTKDRTTNMGHHFNGDDCSIQNLVFVPIDTVEEHLSNHEAETRLKKLETYWIRKVCSVQPWGMNYLETDTEVRTNST